ncbi:MAG: hypothetical protein J3R72DRAFT_433014 [Linnemannia gamsii]|nr:MAG: hypothetical protein J3R72DRAFT_433014 [Linnemannia gamsii]
MLGGGVPRGGAGGGGFVTSPISIPLTHELMEYAAMTAAMSPNGPTSLTSSTNTSFSNLPALISSMSSSPSLSSSLGSPPSSTGSGSPLSPPGYNHQGIMGQQQLLQQPGVPLCLSPQNQQHLQAVGLGQAQLQSYFFQTQQQQQQQQQQQDPLELAAMNMHMNMNSQGSSRRQRYKPAPVRTL